MKLKLLISTLVVAVMAVAFAPAAFADQYTMRADVENFTVSATTAAGERTDLENISYGDVINFSTDPTSDDYSIVSFDLKIPHREGKVKHLEYKKDAPAGTKLEGKFEIVCAPELEAEGKIYLQPGYHYVYYGAVQYQDGKPMLYAYNHERFNITDSEDQCRADNAVKPVSPKDNESAHPDERVPGIQYSHVDINKDGSGDPQHMKYGDVLYFWNDAFSNGYENYAIEVRNEDGEIVQELEGKINDPKNHPKFSFVMTCDLEPGKHVLHGDYTSDDVVDYSVFSNFPFVIDDVKDNCKSADKVVEDEEGNSDSTLINPGNKDSDVTPNDSNGKPHDPSDTNAEDEQKTTTDAKDKTVKEVNKQAGKTKKATLAVTGANADAVSYVAVLLLMLGAGVIVTSRRRA